MPDTGAPWNIPYVEASDLVRDYPAADEAQALAIAAGLTSVSVVRQVVQTIKTDTFSMTDTAYAEVTGLTVAITPESASNKVLVVCSVPLGFTTSGGGGSPTGELSIFRGNTNLAVPSSPGSRIPAMHSTVATTGSMEAANFAFLDSPATTSSTTYGVRLRRSPNGGTIYVNRTSLDDDDATRARGVATITAIEVIA
jgi:hypothetical protein